MSNKGTETDIPETFQSLLVAFSLALAFRGFVVEGFVIPTGSMAPTLLGEHVRFQTPDTGYEYALDPSPVRRSAKSPSDAVAFIDPMISQDRSVGIRTAQSIFDQRLAGDRVLVLKYLYEFFEPDRWDVVVFKSPTDPIGPSQNYIKRMVGLPNEQLLVVDGDVFTAAPGAELSEFRITRRPEYIQESVWQPVYDSDYVPEDPKELQARLGRPFEGPPFKTTGTVWSLDDTRTWRCETDAKTRLDWADDELPIDDFNAYNAWRYPQKISGTRQSPRGRLVLRDVDAVSDLRLSAAIDPDVIDDFGTTLELSLRGHRFRMKLASTTVSIEMLDGEGERVGFAEGTSSPGPGGLLDVVFTHVDQSLMISVGGKEAVRLDYEWSPMERLEATYIDFDLKAYRRDPGSLRVRAPRISWNFEGSPFTLRNVRLERDLHYKTGILDRGQQVAANRPFIEGMLHSTDPLKPSQLGPDQFLMFGDNSGASRDCRYWGRPHPISIDVTGDDTPFVVHRDLLVGKAWCVYFPAPNRIADQGPAIVPDLGRFRFIR